MERKIAISLALAACAAAPAMANVQNDSFANLSDCLAVAGTLEADPQHGYHCVADGEGGWTIDKYNPSKKAKKAKRNPHD